MSQVSRELRKPRESSDRSRTLSGSSASQTPGPEAWSSLGVPCCLSTSRRLFEVTLDQAMRTYPVAIRGVKFSTSFDFASQWFDFAASRAQVDPFPEHHGHSRKVTNHSRNLGSKNGSRAFFDGLHCDRAWRETSKRRTNEGKLSIDRADRLAREEPQSLLLGPKGSSRPGTFGSSRRGRDTPAAFGLREVLR